MTQIIISESKDKEENLLYLQSAINTIVQSAGSRIEFIESDNRCKLILTCMDYFGELIHLEIIDKIAEIIVVKYKYEYFKKNLLLGGLSKDEREIMFASLIAADLEDDKSYAIEKIKGYNDIAVDGAFNFLLRPLQKKWQEVVSLIPSCFMPSQLKDFVCFLLENKKKRIYIDGTRVFDSHYRELKRANLLDGEDIKLVREVLLSNCGIIELSGKTPSLDEKYLKEFYGDKIIFV